jgi:cobalt/nickel transport system permease protein
VLIEQSAYSNRWRSVSPAAKGLFAACGFVAIFAAKSPLTATLIAGLLLLVTLIGAGITPGRYLRIATPALFFLAMGSLSLAFAVDVGVLHLAPNGLSKLAEVGTRSLGALAALLFLVLTTPLVDLIALLRRLKTPELLLEIMVLCYRMLFVFSAAVHETWNAQSARLGYASARLTIRSLGGLVANLTLQIWQRAHALHLAAQARNNDGPLRFLETSFANSGRDCRLAGLAGAGLIALAVGMA